MSEPSRVRMRREAAPSQPPSLPPASDEAASASSSPATSRRYRIALVSDFFYPRLGGVELHQYQIAAALKKRGRHGRRRQQRANRHTNLSLPHAACCSSPFSLSPLLHPLAGHHVVIVTGTYDESDGDRRQGVRVMEGGIRVSTQQQQQQQQQHAYRQTEQQRNKGGWRRVTLF